MRWIILNRNFETAVPNNGLVIYCGTIVTDEGKEKKVNIDFEPFKPINTSLYLCDNKFHTEALQGLLFYNSQNMFMQIYWPMIIVLALL